jgi:two-component system NtrC family response regulator
LVASAHGGTLYLDEVGALPANQQAALLRLLESQPGAESAAPDLRLVSSSHEDLARRAAAGDFREDLYYRISALQLRIPPLRERAGDVGLLATQFLARFAAEQGRGPLRFSDAALAALESHAWPGNVRELRNRVMQAVLLCEANVLGPEHLGLPPATGAADAPSRRTVRSLRECRNQAERDAIADALREAHGHVPVAAHALGISRAQLYRLIGRLRLPTPPNGAH